MKMATHEYRLYRFFMSIPLLLVVALSESDLVREIVSLRSSAESGVISLDDDGVSRFITSVTTPRPYSLIIFFDAIHLYSKSELRLQDFRREFDIASASFIANNNGSDLTKLFFCVIESSLSEASFHRFAVKSLPHIYLVDPWMVNLQDESGQMDGADYDGFAESTAEFVERRTKLALRPIHRPPLLSKIQISLIAALILISAPSLIKKALKGETPLHDHRLWMFGALFVYFFSVAGTMHNIINKVPLFVRDYEDENKLVFFYDGTEMQFGAESFAVGFLYTVVGLLLAFISNVLVRVENVNDQRMMTLLSLLISLWAVMTVLNLNNWKTGYQIYPFWWPSS